MGWLVALPTLAALYVINKRIKGKVRKPTLQDIVAVATMAVAALAGCGLVFTFFGDWTAGLVGWIAGFFHDRYASVGVALALVVIFVGIAVADIAFDRQADKGAQFAAIIMPTLLVLVIGGSLGNNGGGAVKSTRDQVANVMLQWAGQSVKGHK